MIKNKFTYNEAVAELQAILAELEDTTIEVNIEDLNSKIKRASELMAFCKKQLHEIDKDLEKLMETL